MKIGIISDVHADLKMLRRALDLLEDQRVDTLVCAGDLVYRGHEGDAVVELIRQRDIPCVQGNHDSETAEVHAWLMSKEDLEQSAYRSQLLRDDTMQFVDGLPETLRFIWAGMRVLLAHGTPNSKYETLFSESPAARFQAIASESDADIIIIGHTHEVMQVRVGDVWFLNPGSVWHNRFGSVKHTCAVLTLPDFDFEVFDIVTGYPIAVPVIELPLD